jgi:hypothetical protein
MIKINLLKSELPRHSLVSLAEGKTASRKWVVSIALVTVAGVGAYMAWNEFAKPKVVTQHASVEIPEPAPAPEPKVEAPPEPPMVVNAAPPGGEAVEDIVGELARHAEASPKARTYNDLVPSERVEYQLQTVQRLLKDIKAVTPSDVGFAELVFTPPGEFYVHGLAYSSASLAQFEQGLKGLQGAEIKPGKMATVGSGSHQAHEFSYYCKIQYPVSTMPSNHLVVERNKVDLALRDALGLNLKTPRLTGREDAGNLQRLVFATTADMSYDKLTDFLEQMRSKQSPLGVLRVSLKARGDEDMVADLDLVAYVDQPSRR